MGENLSAAAHRTEKMADEGEKFPVWRSHPGRGPEHTSRSVEDRPCHRGHRGRWWIGSRRKSPSRQRRVPASNSPHLPTGRELDRGIVRLGRRKCVSLFPCSLSSVLDSRRWVTALICSRMICTLIWVIAPWVIVSENQRRGSVRLVPQRL